MLRENHREYHLRGLSLRFPALQFYTDFAAEDTTCGLCRLNMFCINLLLPFLFAYWLQCVSTFLTHIDLRSLSSDLHIDLHSLSSDLLTTNALQYQHTACQQP